MVTRSLRALIAVASGHPSVQPVVKMLIISTKHVVGREERYIMIDVSDRVAAQSGGVDWDYE
jgi:hypothetical protein